MRFTDPNEGLLHFECTDKVQFRHKGSFAGGETEAGQTGVEFCFQRKDGLQHGMIAKGLAIPQSVRSSLVGHKVDWVHVVWM